MPSLYSDLKIKFDVIKEKSSSKDHFNPYSNTSQTNYPSMSSLPTAIASSKQYMTSKTNIEEEPQNTSINTKSGKEKNIRPSSVKYPNASSGVQAGMHKDSRLQMALTSPSKQTVRANQSSLEEEMRKLAIRQKNLYSNLISLVDKV